MKSFQIKGLHCPSCVVSIEQALTDSGFDNITVNLDQELLFAPEETDIEAVKEIVEKTGGYELILT
ncbi:MAG: heavy-metal-associated domain-containing protein [Candidatus Dojkabacteria bacterium]